LRGLQKNIIIIIIITKKQKKQQKQPSVFRKLVLYGTGAFVIGGILIYSFAGPNLAAETMAMQQDLVQRKSK
jgi:glycopeptide antibiotics resistance protein